MMDFFTISADYIKFLAPFISGLTALLVVIAAFRSGALSRIKFGSFEVVASKQERQDAEALVRSIASAAKELPFETEQLAKYYARVLAQSKTSFWFSLIFASIGFLVIVFAVFSFTSSTLGTSVVQLSAGVVIDAVAALFFVQSRNAQKSMGDFFDKLRKERQQVESRTLCDSISDGKAQDALRVQLSLYYAGIPDYQLLSKDIVERCLTEGRSYPRSESGAKNSDKV
jgi:hypothetical protein